jgi:hypothetical protein
MFPAAYVHVVIKLRGEGATSGKEGGLHKGVSRHCINSLPIKLPPFGSCARVEKAESPARCKCVSTGGICSSIMQAALIPCQLRQIA